MVAAVVTVEPLKPGEIAEGPDPERPRTRYFGHFANNGLQPERKQHWFTVPNRAARRHAMKPTRRHGPNVRTSPRVLPYSALPMRTSKILRAVARQAALHQRMELESSV